jgi:hypothetical protein
MLRLKIVVLLALLSVLAPYTALAQVDSVELDPESGTFSRNLPFDVPYVITGLTPPGTTGVTVQYEEKAELSHEFDGTLKPREAVVSGVDAEGRFGVKMNAAEPNRYFRFHVGFERRLPAPFTGTFRDTVNAVLRRELRRYVRLDMSNDAAQALRQALVFSLQRALNEGQLIASPRVDVAIEAPGTLFDDGLSMDEARDEIARLSSDVIARQAEREQALGLYRNTVPSLLDELSRVCLSPALAVLMDSLQQRPELDPRNPRNNLYLSEDASRLIGLGDVERDGLAKGLSFAETPVELEDTYRAEDADRMRARYLRTARALRDLREWLTSLVAVGATDRRFVDELLAAGEMGAQQVDDLQRLAGSRRGPIRRAEQWAETLEVYVYDVQKSLTARERALEEMVAILEAQALEAVVRQSTQTQVVSSEAGVYVSMDIGVLYPPELERAAVSIGANIYTRPVNKKAPLGLKGSWRHRTSVTVGITVTNLKAEDETRFENLLGERSSLFAGMGVRVTKSIRLGGGLVFFLKNDPNPLVTDRSLAVTPYFSFSFDLDLIGVLRSN